VFFLHNIYLQKLQKAHEYIQHIIDNKRVETLKHTSLHGPTIVTHSTLRLEGNSLKQINLCECDAKIKFEGFVFEEPIHFKNGTKHFFKQVV
jgi:hypothetical protein